MKITIKEDSLRPIMKTGNNYNEFLDTFAKNYSIMAKMHANIAEKSQELNSLVKEADDTELSLIEVNVPKPNQKSENKIYDDFLDKFAKNKIADENRIKEQIFKFVNTEANRDNHICELILRKVADKYKIKLTHYSGIIDYAAFQSIWHFSEQEEKTANKVFDTLAFTINGIKEEHNKNQRHSTTLTPMIREAVKSVSEAHQYRKNILSLDESDLQVGESNWERTLYGNKYPEYQEESKQEMLSNNHCEGSVKRTVYTGRNSKTTKRI